VAAVEIMMHPLEVPVGSSSHGSQRLQELPPLLKPYVKVPAGILLPVLKNYVVDRLAGKKGEASRMPPLVFKCAGQVLSDDSWTVQDIVDKVWAPHCSRHNDKADIMIVYYAAASS
jgi:hypothetical protein